MPVPSRHINIGRSQSWDAAGWYEGPWEVAEAPGRRSSLTDGGGEGPWYPGLRDVAMPGAAEPCLYREAFYSTAAGRKSSVPDFAFYDSRQAVMSARGALLPGDYYSDPAGAARAPGEPPHHRHPGAGQPLPGYGAPGSRMTWEPVAGRGPVLQDTGHLYRDPGGKMIPQGQRSHSRAASPVRYVGEPADSRYGAEAPAYPTSQVYNDASERPVDSATSRQAAPTCLVVEPGAAAASGIGMGTAPGAPPRGYGPAREGVHPRMAYERCEADPPAFQGPGGSKRSVMPEFLALLRAEGVAEATLVALLQQGFDSPAVLATMEDADIKCVAPNLGQARVLSRLASGCRTEMQLRRQGRGASLPRTRSSSFSHRSELQGDPASLGAAILQPQPQAGPLQTASPRAADPAHRRPSSAPSQHLLETAATYSAPGVGAQAAHFPSNSGYSSPTPCALTARLGPAYPLQAGVPLTHPGPRTAYSTAYTVPMELLKRERGAAASPVPSPHGSPQLLRKPGAPLEPPALPPASQSLHTPHSPYQKVARRTGAPIIVSTMLAPEPSNSPLLAFSSRGTLRGRTVGPEV